VGRAEDFRQIERALQMLVRLNASRRLHGQRSSAAGVFISQPGYNLLSRIDEDGTLRLSDLGKLTHMDPATVGRQVRQLEDEGLVASGADAADARVTLVRITPKGHDIHQRLLKIAQVHMAEALDEWDSGDRAELARLLTRLMDDLVKTRYRETEEAESA
jgi:DNA-binding MarR family transcriptional regulator